MSAWRACGVLGCAHLERVCDIAMRSETGNEAAACSSTWAVGPADRACCWQFPDNSSLPAPQRIELTPLPGTLECTQTADLAFCCDMSYNRSRWYHAQMVRCRAIVMPGTRRLPSYMRRHIPSPHTTAAHTQSSSAHNLNDHCVINGVGLLLRPKSHAHTAELQHKAAAVTVWGALGLIECSA